MFNVQSDRQLGLQFFDQKKNILNGIHITVNVDPLGECPLEFVNVKTEQLQNQFGNYERSTHLYQYKDKIDLSFIVESYEDIVQAYVDVVIHNERAQGHHDYLASEEAIKIHVNNLSDLQGVVAHYRHKDWWTRPHFNQDLSTLPPRTQSLLWENDDSVYHILPAVGSTFKSEMKGSDQGFDIIISSFDGGRVKASTFAFILAKGENPFALVKKTTERLLELSGNAKMIDEKRYPERLDYLGWCSWDAFYQEVHQDGIVNKVKELKEKQVPVKWLMIDDGWSQVNDQRLSSFEPDSKKFPKGFKTLTDDLKTNYGIQSIGVWHTLAGYWGGVDPESSLATTMAPYLFRTNSNRLVPYPDRSKGFGFWDAWHSYLEQQGIDFVKVDGQSGVYNFLREHMSTPEATIESHKALEASVGIHFDHCVINCMGMASDNVYNRPMSAVSRSSDDFVPDTEEYGFAEHALQNVYNAVYHGELYYGDWDMFWTVHRDANRHALLRAVSGGPIYTSDRVGKTNADILWPLIFKDGKILLCDQPGRPTADTLMKDPTTEDVPMKIWNTSNGVGVLATFHVNDAEKQIKGQISPADIETIQAEDYIMYDYFNQTAVKMGHEDRHDITLEKEGFGLYLFIPMKHAITPIGLINKYISASTYQVLYSTAEKIVVQLKEAGPFALVAEQQPQKATVNGEDVTVTNLASDPSIYVIDCQSEESLPIIEIQL